jgi:hypothetical protein
MSEMAYAVHTGACTYLLDEDGVCRWVLSPGGLEVSGAERCVGAQFVACLDLREAGGLVGELRLGAAALFACYEHGRFALLRTAPIEHVEFRAGAEPGAPPPREEHPAAPADPPTDEIFPPAEPTGPLPAWSAPSAPLPAYPSFGEGGSPGAAPRPPVPSPQAVEPTQRLSLAGLLEPDTGDAIEEIDVEDLVTYNEITLTNPLFRPEAQPQPPAPPHAFAPRAPGPRRGVIGPGRRLR